ncbi:MAG: class I SAM-dependent RNA methyltransferase [Deltaproteobacteria bacterium]|nr:class I SAM-dependent RNA methyltransferase [Deltaproteobacteria bacterium]
MNEALTVHIEKLLWRGRGLARLDSGQVVMVEPGVLPGEDVRVRVVKTAKDYILAEAEEILAPSPLRQTHPCPHADRCGGSRFGIVSPDHGLQLKEAMLRDAVGRALGRERGPRALENLEVIPSPQGWRYRWRGQIHVRNGRPHAMAHASNELVTLTDCHLLAAPLARSMPDLAADLPDGRFTIAASPVTGEAVHERSARELEFSFPDFGLSVHLPAATFFQANWSLNQELVRRTVRAVDGATRVADLFAGAGNFALPLASQGKTILAVEGCAAATRTGARNAARLGLRSVRFRDADLGKPKAWKMVHDFDPEVVILDPPRTGAKNIARTLLALPGPRRLIWISCDVVNTIRDAKPLLEAGWQISTMALLDMFPGTWHMEVLMVLDR